jgi:hypothetical protein
MRANKWFVFTLIGVLLVFPDQSNCLTTDAQASDSIMFSKHSVTASFDGASAVRGVDLNGDGHIDILGAAELGDEVAWWANDGTPVDGGWTKRVIADDFYGANFVYPADLDGDLDLDVLGAARDTDEIAWWENDGTPVDGGWTKHTISDSLDRATDVCAKDLDGDGDLDVLGAGYAADAIAWWENDGAPADGGWVEHVIAEDFDGAASVYATDLNDDTFVDVVGAASGDYVAGDGRIVWWQSDGTPADGGWITHTLDADFALATDVSAADLDGDDDVDILAVGVREYGFAWWENDGAEDFIEHTVSGDFGYAASLCAIDVDGDGDMDVTASSSIDGIVWWENDGSQGFARHTITDDVDRWFSMDAIDVDGDTDTDILGAGFSSGQIMWWEQRTSRFVFLPLILKPMAPPPPMTLYLHARGGTPRYFLSEDRDDGDETIDGFDGVTEWVMTLEQDLFGTEYGYSLYAAGGLEDVVCDVEILLRKDGSDITLASWPGAFEALDGDFEWHTGTKTGVDPGAQAGDTLVLRIRTHDGGITMLMGDFYGTPGYSRIEVPGYGP